MFEKKDNASISLWRSDAVCMLAVAKNCSRTWQQCYFSDLCTTPQGGSCQDHTHVRQEAEAQSCQQFSWARQASTVCLPVSGLSVPGHLQLFCLLVRIFWRDWPRYICAQECGTAHTPRPRIAHSRNGVMYSLKLITYIDSTKGSPSDPVLIIRCGEGEWGGRKPRKCVCEVPSLHSGSSVTETQHLTLLQEPDVPHGWAGPATWNE